ncbi:E3 ubiquitin-protein ligase SHPRH [Linum perenne]
MGRRKQSRPHRSGGVVIEPSKDACGSEFEKGKTIEADDVADLEDEPFLVQVDRTGWTSVEHLDLSEVVLTNLCVREQYHTFAIDDDFYQDSKYSLWVCVANVNNSALNGIRFGHWPMMLSDDVKLELIEKVIGKDGEERESVILSVCFDGPDEGVSGLAHLISLKFVTLRPVPGFKYSEGLMTMRMRVEVMKDAFDACESLLDIDWHLWKKSMMNVMSWLRPEVMISEARYGVTKSMEVDMDSVTEIEDDGSTSRKCARFDVAGFYEAIKPSKSEPMLEDDLPDLVPVLRPYQRRAVYWMVQREKGDILDERAKSDFFSPMSLPVSFLDTSKRMFYNPFSGNISLEPESSPPPIFGGILADEMGLGKTVELLACVFAHRRSECDGDMIESGQKDVQSQKALRRLKQERVECICGAVTESYKYTGLWVQCDMCDAWQHADCVGYSPKGKRKRSTSLLHKDRKKTMISFVERDGQHMCQMCSEILQATDSPVTSGATLIVCPSPILSQWHAEIIRHTRSGSLKVCIYEGVRESSLSNKSAIDIGELASADIVLTTYDVFRADLSHDSDRHEGDRRFLRFQKRYPVIPTRLTRIFWWRLCLDEAQMVESNGAAATEMALRLSAKHRWCVTGTPIQRKLDDLYGLLRFLKVRPFDVCRWWIDVMRDPYERQDKGAMEFTHKFFKQIMWRSSKSHVADELQIPPQEECISWLALSAIEEHFYQRQHEMCLSHAREVIGSLKADIVKRETSDYKSSSSSTNPLITHTEAAKLLTSLLKLRQACCHPQVGSSGLRSLQQSPMTMEEILQVLVSKTKVEGEEALRKLVIALNALAGIAIIKQDFGNAVTLYREALALAEEHSEDFRLDPLLDIHIHHNLSEVLIKELEFTSETCSRGDQCKCSNKVSEVHDTENSDLSSVKMQNAGVAFDASDVLEPSKNSLNSDQESENKCFATSRSFNVKSLSVACESLKQKFLSVFSSKLYVTQQDFKRSYMQVVNELGNSKDRHSFWWLDALDHSEQNKGTANELITKIEEAISGSQKHSNPSRFRSIAALKYHIQTRFDQVEASRKLLLDRVLEIDQTMENPKEEDIERVRYCRVCQAVDDGPTCVHCELEELFKDYEARLFRLNKADGEIISSAEEAVDLQKKNSELNRFYWNLSRHEKNSTLSGGGNEESRKRDVGERVMVSKMPSELEVVLGVVKSYCKAHLGKEHLSAANKQLHLLEGMRKEYSSARSLAVTQAQFLRAHDEIRMATSRLHLREDENDKSLDALGPEELDTASVLQSNDKFLALTDLSRIKGKLRYLKGLVQSKQKAPSESSNNLSSTQETTSASLLIDTTSDALPKDDEEACPICHEKLNDQKMVFQCGHCTCCKCLLALTEPNEQDHKFQSRKWVMCPTCRQHTDYRNIAYVDDRQGKSSDPANRSTTEDCKNGEASVTVHGSYGTKLEAVTRRILLIKASDSEAKVLVFSSWNDVLDVLEHAFKANGITYIRMKGGRKSDAAISEFRGQNKKKAESKSIQVLLLLIQHGANGLNLLEAQHVVLVEPLLNPAAEAQAIGRVHRIGQDKRTLVHRFIVKNTVEESIHQLNRSRNTTSFISGNTKNQDQPVLTLKDVESLFASSAKTFVNGGKEPEEEEPSGNSSSLRQLPPAVAAAMAAERRLMENGVSSSSVL